MLDKTEREELVQTSIKILQQKLKKQRLAKEKKDLTRRTSFENVLYIALIRNSTDQKGLHAVEWYY